MAVDAVRVRNAAKGARGARSLVAAAVQRRGVDEAAQRDGDAAEPECRAVLVHRRGGDRGGLALCSELAFGFGVPSEKPPPPVAGPCAYEPGALGAVATGGAAWACCMACAASARACEASSCACRSARSRAVASRCKRRSCACSWVICCWIACSCDASCAAAGRLASKPPASAVAASSVPARRPDRPIMSSSPSLLGHACVGNQCPMFYCDTFMTAIRLRRNRNIAVNSRHDTVLPSAGIRGQANTVRCAISATLRGLPATARSRSGGRSRSEAYNGGGVTRPGNLMTVAEARGGAELAAAECGACGGGVSRPRGAVRRIQAA